MEFIENAGNGRKNCQTRIPVAVVTNKTRDRVGLHGIDVVPVGEYVAGRLHRHGTLIRLSPYCPHHVSGGVESFTCMSAGRKSAPGVARATALNLAPAALSVVGSQPQDLGLKAAAARACTAQAVTFAWPQHRIFGRV